ncbi:hypothetical protein [Brevibacillus sp. SYSU BS000544]
MSFDVDIAKILQYAYNIFASASPLSNLFVGGSFGLFILGGLLGIFKK